MMNKIILVLTPTKEEASPQSRVFLPFPLSPLLMPATQAKHKHANIFLCEDVICRRGSSFGLASS